MSGIDLFSNCSRFSSACRSPSSWPDSREAADQQRSDANSNTRRLVPLLGWLLCESRTANVALLVFLIALMIVGALGPTLAGASI